MTKPTIIKVAGLTLLAAVAVYTQYRPEKAQPGSEARAEAVSSASKAGSAIGIARKEAVQYADGMAPWQQEPREPFELTEKDTPLDLITTLINAPFNQEPGQTINDKNNWRVIAYPPEYCDPPSYSKIFRRKGPGMEISLYSYTVPSLTEAKELIMAGELKIFEELDKNTADALLNITTGERRPFKMIEQNAVLDLLKSSGFEAKPTEKHLSSPGGRNWTDVMEIQKGALSGLLYFEPHGSARALKLRLEHKDSGTYSYRGPAAEQYTKFAQFAVKLNADLERQGAVKIIGAAWPEIKNMIAVSSVVFPVPLETLLGARNAILTSRPEGAGGAPFMILQTRIMVRIFQLIHYYPGNDTDSPPKELKLLEKNGIEYELKNYGDTFYAPKENSVFKVYGEYPDTYWGQHAFLTKMEDGFSEDGYNQSTSQVITEGEGFLRKHPDSPFLTRALFLIGKAHETAYSSGSSRGATKAGEEHRLSAIKYFTDVLARPDGKEYEEHLRYILPKLRTKGSAYCAFYINCNPC